MNESLTSESQQCATEKDTYATQTNSTKLKWS